MQLFVFQTESEMKMGMVLCVCDPDSQRVRQEKDDLEANLGNIVRLCLPTLVQNWVSSEQWDV